MNKLFLITLIPLSIISNIIIYNSIGKSFSGRYIVTGIYSVVLALVSAKFLIPLIYYVLFKYIGKIEVTFEEVSKTLFPIIIIQYSFSCLVVIILSIVPTIKPLVQIAIYIWFLIMDSMILKYKYMIGPKRTLSILEIPIIIYIISWLIKMV